MFLYFALYFKLCTLVALPGLFHHFTSANQTCPHWNSTQLERKKNSTFHFSTDTTAHSRINSPSYPSCSIGYAIPFAPCTTKRTSPPGSCCGLKHSWRPLMQERDQRVLEQFSRGVIDMDIFEIDTNRVSLNLVRVQSPGHKKYP